MPYGLKEAATGRLLACSQVNGYQLPYFGIILWEDAPGDAMIANARERAGIADSDGWEPAELTEHEAKMANVKLRNDPRRRVYLRDGALTSDMAEDG